MKKTYLLTLTAILFCSALSAEKIKGRILFVHDTVDVIFKIPVKFFADEPDYSKLQYKVKYFDSTGTKQTLLPDRAVEIQFKYGSETIRMLSRGNTLGGGKLFSPSSHIFLKLEHDGELKVFKYYYTSQYPGAVNPSTGMITGGVSYTETKYVLQKGNGHLQKIHGITFKKDMVEYFSDCPGLVDNIENKVYRKKDLEMIVDFYNSYCR